MPIFVEDSAAPAPAPPPLKVTPTPYSGVATDTRYTPLSALLTFVSGAAWTVDYYSQVLDKDNEVSAQQVGLAAPYQQYRKINRMEIKVTTPLSTSQEDDTKTMVVTGAATVYPGVIPNKGDVFVADAGDGQLAIFSVTNTTKMSILKDAAYTIEYQLLQYYVGARKADLETKVIQQLYFVKDYLLNGRNPYLIHDDYQRLGDYSHIYRRLLADYLATFFSVEKQCLLVPNQKSLTYDPFINAKVLNWFSQEDNPLLARLTPLNVNGDLAMQMGTVLDAIEQMDQYILPTVAQKMALVNTSCFRDFPQLHTIFFTGIGAVVFPTERRTDVDQTYRAVRTIATTRMQTSSARWNDLERVLVDTDLGNALYETTDGGLPDIHKVTDTGDYYIFSKAFYFPDSGPYASKFEALVHDAIEGKVLDQTVLSHLAQQAVRWENLERFYFIPILLALLKCAILRGS